MLYALYIDGEKAAEGDFSVIDEFVSNIKRNAFSSITNDDEETFFPGVKSLPVSYRYNANCLVEDWNKAVDNWIRDYKIARSEFLPRIGIFSPSYISAYRKQHKILLGLFNDKERIRDFWRVCIAEIFMRVRGGDRWVKENGDLLHLIRQSTDRYGRRYIDSITFGGK